MSDPNAIAHDASGFLVGPKLGDGAVEKHLQSIRSDTSRILALMTRAGAVAQATAIRQATQQRRPQAAAGRQVQNRARDTAGRFVAAASVTSEVQRSQGRSGGVAGHAGAAEKSAIEAIGRHAKDTATAAGRMARGADAARRSNSFDSKSQQRGADGRYGGGRGKDGFGSTGAVSAVADSVKAATANADQIDPIIGAMGELKGVADRVSAVATPLGRIIPGLRGRKDDTPSILARMWRGFQSRWKREDGTQKSMLATLKDIDGKAGRSGGDAGGGGLMSVLSMIPLLGGLVPGLASAAGIIASAAGMLRGLFTGGGGGVASAAKGLLSRLPVIGPIIAAALGLAADSAIAGDTNLTPEERQRRRMQNGGESAGGLAGGMAGAAIGSAILPGIGTVVGAVLGALAGSSVGKMLADALNENMGDIKATWDKAVSVVGDTFEPAKKVFSGLMDWLSGLPGFKAIKETVAPVVAPVVEAGRGLADKASGVASKAFDSAKSIGGKALGWISSIFESGGKGAAAVSTGAGDRGGASYGTHQLSSKTGTLKKFLDSSGYGAQFAGMEPGSKEFNAKWKDLAKDQAFGDAQHDFIKRTHYDPQMAKLKSSGLDLGERGRSVQEAIWSTSVQFGGSTGLIQRALAGKNVASMSDAQVVSAIQDYKAENNDKLFASSSAGVRAGTLKRATAERTALLSAASAPVVSTSSASLSPSVATVAPVAPSIPKMPPAVSQPTDASPQRQREAVRVVQAPAPPRQDVPDRSIAHIVTGGISGWPLR